MSEGETGPVAIDRALEGRVAIVTGASRGIGRGCAVGLGARHGFAGHTAGLVADGHAMASF